MTSAPAAIDGDPDSVCRAFESHPLASGEALSRFLLQMSDPDFSTIDTTLQAASRTGNAKYLAGVLMTGMAEYKALKV